MLRFGIQQVQILPELLNSLELCVKITRGGFMKLMRTEVSVENIIQLTNNELYKVSTSEMDEDFIRALIKGFPSNPIYCYREDSGELRVLAGSEKLNSLISADKQGELLDRVKHRKLIVEEIILEDEPESVLDEVIRYLRR